MEDKYIKLLRQARDLLRENKGMSFSKFKGESQALGFPHDDVQESNLYNMIYGQFDPTSDQNWDFEKRMHMDAYMQLLDYENLEQARQDSKDARKEAKTALRIATLALVIGILVGLGEILVSIYK